MKKIIKGKLYNTDTATHIGNQCHDIGNFNYCNENLYRKKTGEYFLHVEGGPMSKYAESTGQNEWSGGEEIIPYSYAEAKEWVERHLSADDYEKEFGVVEEGTTCMSVYLTAETHKKLKIKASETGKPMTKIVEELIEKSL